MEFDEVQALVDEHIQLIAFSKNSYKEAMDRATKFLVIAAIVAEFKRDQREKLTKREALRDAFYSKAIQESEGKNITEKKSQVALNKDYSEHAEVCGVLEANISWCSTMIDIFNNAHVTYRQLAKGD